MELYMTSALLTIADTSGDQTLGVFWFAHAGFDGIASYVASVVHVANKFKRNIHTAPVYSQLSQS